MTRKNHFIFLNDLIPVTSKTKPKKSLYRALNRFIIFEFRKGIVKFEFDFMKINLIVIGKTNKNFLIEGEAEYQKRLKKYIQFEKIEIPDLKNAKNLSESEIKKEEGKLILAKVQPSGLVVLLDDKGQHYTSMQLSEWIQDSLNRGFKHITFIVGGAYGFSEDVYAIGQQKMSLSKMTFSHQMIRLFFTEQIYRSFTILNNEPYHHE